MEFVQAAKLAKKGKKIRRKGWGGYWEIVNYDGISGKPYWHIHCKDGRDLVDRFNDETIWNTLEKDWEVIK